jgi:ankyrin repeat protein
MNSQIRPVLSLLCVALFVPACQRHESVTTTSPSTHAGSAPSLIGAIDANDEPAVRAALRGTLTKKELGDALEEAAAGGNVPIGKILIDRGAEVNYVDSDNTPLIAAATTNRSDFIKLLVQRGADVNAAPAGETALECAAETGSFEATRSLLQLGADPNVSKKNLLPIHYAAEYGHSDIVRLLMQYGAKVNEPADDMTPLMWAINGEHWDTAKVLLELGADPNVKDVSTLDTPLHSAAAAHNVDMVRTLVHYGAKKDARTKFGKTPLDEALRKNPSDPKLAEIKAILTGAATQDVRPASSRPTGIQ